MKKIVVLLLVLMLGACSTKFAYKNLDWLVYWYIDDYVELNPQQEAQFDEALARWLAWHKEEELPRYQSQLQEITQQIKDKSLDYDKIAQHKERARQHWVRARIYVANDLVDLAITLDSEQISSLFEQLEKDNAEEEEEIEESFDLKEKDRVKKWNKRNQKNVKRWFGRLSDEQKTYISAYYERFKATRVKWLAYKREYQSQAKTLMLQELRDEEFKTELYDLIVNPEQFRTAQFQQAIEENSKAGDEFLIGLLKLANDKQLSKVIKEINEYRDDIESLQKPSK